MVESEESQRMKQRKAGNCWSDCFVGEALLTLVRAAKTT